MGFRFLGAQYVSSTIHGSFESSVYNMHNILSYFFIEILVH